jgi:hypothetical protein
MPPLTNHRHELFAQGLAQGRSASEAYRNAGYRPNDGNACTLKGDQRISKRVEEIVQENASIHREGVAKAIEAKKVTVESILDDLARALAGAEKDQDWKGMVAAAIGQARVAGLMVDRHLVKAQHEFAPSEMSDVEIYESLRSMRESRALALGVDPSTITLQEFWDLEDTMHEAHMSAEEEGEPSGSRHMAPIGSRGIRAPEYRPPKRELTRAEANKLYRRDGPPKLISVTTNGRR